MAKPKIIIADDEPHVLEAIRRNLEPLAEDWDIRFAANGHEVLAAMAEGPADVVVTDIAMPGLDGKALIVQLYHRFPNTVPVVLSGHWVPALASRELGPHVRFLAKPASTEVLVWAIRGALREVVLTATPHEWSERPPQSADLPAMQGTTCWVNATTR